MTDFKGLVAHFLDLIALIVPLIFALTIVVLSWGIIKAWIINSGDETSVQEGKNMALVGVIALVCMVGIWGILNLLQNAIFPGSF